MTAASLSACALLPTEDEPLSAPLLNAYEQQQPTLAVARRDDLVQTKTISCRSRPIREQTYSFPVGGIYVERVYVSVGDSVSAGDMLAELDRKEILTQVEEAEIATRKQEYALELARDDSELRRIEYNLQAYNAFVGNTGVAANDGITGSVANTVSAGSGSSAMSAGSAVNANSAGVALNALNAGNDGNAAAPEGDGEHTAEIDALLSQYEKALENYLFGVSYAEKMLEIAERKLETLREMAEERVIYSTIDGVVSYAHRYAAEDRSVAGDKAFTISDASELIYAVTGDDAMYFTPGEIYQMKVSKSMIDIRAFSPEDIGEAPPASPVVYFVPDDLTSGLASYGYITVETKRRNGALYLPANAIIQVGDEFAIYRIGESGFRELSMVEIGDTISGKTEILSGLSEGDEVILD